MVLYTTVGSNHQEIWSRQEALHQRWYKVQQHWGVYTFQGVIVYMRLVDVEHFDKCFCGQMYSLLFWCVTDTKRTSKSINKLTTDVLLLTLSNYSHHHQTTPYCFAAKRGGQKCCKRLHQSHADNQTNSIAEALLTYCTESDAVCLEERELKRLKWFKKKAVAVLFTKTNWQLLLFRKRKKDRSNLVTCQVCCRTRELLLYSISQKIH